MIKKMRPGPIFFLTLIGSWLVLGWFGLIFQIKQQVAALAEAAASVQAVQTSKATAVNLKMAERGLAERQAVLATAAVAGPAGTAKLIEAIETLAKNASTTLEVASAGVADNTNVTHLVLKVSGSFAALERLASTIETMPFLVSIEHFELTRADQTTTKAKKPFWQGQININVANFSLPL